MARLALELELLARLTHGSNVAYMHPWHDAGSDRDVVTNGRSLLTWDGCQFGVAPIDGEAPDEKTVASILEPVAEIGKTTLCALWEWACWGSPECCPGHTPICPGCGEEVAAEAPGAFYHADLDRQLLRRFLAPLNMAGDDRCEVRVCSRGGKDDAIQLVAERWTVVIMPLRKGALECVGPAFPLAGQDKGEAVVEAAVQS